MEELKFDIVEYLGKLSGAIFVLLSLNYKDEFYEGIFCYKDDVLIITVDSKLEELIDCKIEDWIGYQQLLLSISKKVVPYNEMIGRIEDFDENNYKIVYQDR
jgi:hypothetical protein